MRGRAIERLRQLLPDDETRIEEEVVWLRLVTAAGGWPSSPASDAADSLEDSRPATGDSRSDLREEMRCYLEDREALVSSTIAHVLDAVVTSVG